VYVGNECVVDLWADNTGGYSPDHLAMIFSNGRSIASILMAMLHSQGLFEWEDLVTKYWKEFGKNGKEHIRIIDVMRDEAGLADWTSQIDLRQCDTEGIKKGYFSKLFEDMTPYWKQKSKHDDPAGFGPERRYAFHTRDSIVNEIFRRIDKKERTIGEFLKEEMPDIDAHTGITDESIHARIANLRHNPSATKDMFSPSWSRMGPWDIIGVTKSFK